MKKIFLKRVCSALALTAVAASTATMTSFAAIDATPYMDGARNGFTDAEIANSPVKPVVSVTKEILTLNDAKENPVRTVEISVADANLKYCSSGLHLYFDKRLTLNTTPLGTPDVKIGPAAEYLTVDLPTLDPTAEEQGLSGVFMCSAAKMDAGQDGVIWRINFTLPSDAKEGDAYPIDIFYKSVPAAEDLFTNNADDEEGKLMQAYFFTQSINNGVTKSFTATKAETDECAAIGSLDPSTDGYIAIADGEPPVTTAPVTTAATSSTAAPATSSTTAAPATSSTAKPTTTAKPATTTAKTTAGSKDSPKTGVAGVGVAVAGLAVAIGTAFVLRKKED